MHTAALAILSRATRAPEITADGQSVVYYDDATHAYWLADLADLESLPGTGYSQWCAAHSHAQCTADGRTFAGWDIQLPDGSVHGLVRDCAHNHAPEVHHAMGSLYERDLQGILDLYTFAEFIDDRGEYRGRDEDGVGVVFADV